ncbi:MAG: fasciclin domain-containing protein [Breznakibacter sp.]
MKRLVEKWGKKVLMFRLSFVSTIFASAVSLAVLMPSCDSDEVGDNYTTFTGERLGEYLTNRPEQFSEFVELLDTTEIMSLLNAYGNYTCMAPTNDAMKAFYQSKGRQSIDEFPFDSIKIIAYNHLFNGARIQTSEFPNGDWSSFILTMGRRAISTLFTVSEGGRISILVNGVSPVTEGNILVHNGVIHVIDGVVQPSDKKLAEVIESDPDYKLFHSALLETELHLKLQLVEDKTYDSKSYNYPNQGGTRPIGGYMTVPDSKLYGYTVLMESDATFKANGIESLQDLKNLARSIYDPIYPQDKNVDDVTDSRNSLNRFLSYHLINKKLNKKQFVYAYVDPNDIKQSITNLDMNEYVEPMLSNSLIEVRYIAATGEQCALNYDSNTGRYISIIDADNSALNGYYHGIDGILSFNSNVISEISTKRLRLDAASFFPEFTNNNMRMVHSASYRKRYIIPPGYCERLSINEGTEFQYMTPNDGPGALQGDEINCILASAYDITITTPPIPEGNYEIRVGYQPNGNRGVVQIYWDGLPTGIPLDLRIDASDARVGYGANTDNEAGYENDKMMRNRGYMKGPASVKSGTWYGGHNITLRQSSSNLRRILGIYSFNEMKTHSIRFKAVLDGQFQIDFIEFVPTEVLEKEDIY